MPRITAIAILSMLLTCLPSQASVSSNVPLNHWSYEDINRLIGAGKIDSALAETKPFSRLEMARIIAEAMDKADKDNMIQNGILLRLRQEFHEELIAMGKEEGIAAPSYFKPFRTPYLKFIYGDDDFELQNQTGDVFSKSSNLRMGFYSDLKMGDHFSIFLNPEWRYREHEVQHGRENELKLVQGYVKAQVMNLELEVGRDSLWWGPGEHGALLMSNNAQALDMVKLSNPRPALLPWIFRYLGPVQFQTFLARLEDERPIPEPKLWGMRLTFKPHPVAEIGLNRTVMFAGQGREKLGFTDYWKVFLAGEENNPGKLDNNQLASVDLSLRFPLTGTIFDSVNIYGEVGGEDQANWGPSHMGFLAGVYLTAYGGRSDLRIEYANNYVSGAPDAWYRHHIYKAGYTYEGKVIGHHMGSNAEDVFVRLTHYLDRDLLLGLSFDYEKRGVKRTFGERRNYGEIDLTLFNLNRLHLKTAYRYEQIRNYQLISGDSRDNHIIQFQVIYNM
ncbi:MAG: capsule assembly Wzi family protein [Candidatus Schekmanbacteria bacterium]|nr:capsule assembly Wzi family protein [Candidatus Schekmanbacteria bacterium]